MNVEAFSTKRGSDFARLFLIGRSMMIIDESTTIKNPKAKRTKAILDLRKETKYRRILTGSPVTQSPMDLWAQMDFLDPEILGQSSLRRELILLLMIPRVSLRFLHIILSDERLHQGQ